MRFNEAWNAVTQVPGLVIAVLALTKAGSMLWASKVTYFWVCTNSIAYHGYLTVYSHVRVQTLLLALDVVTQQACATATAMAAPVQHVVVLLSLANTFCMCRRMSGNGCSSIPRWTTFANGIILLLATYPCVMGSLRWLVACGFFVACDQCTRRTHIKVKVGGWRFLVYLGAFGFHGVFHLAIVPVMQEMWRCRENVGRV